MNKRGFTLIEVLIAIFILALMSMIIWQITNNTYRGVDKANMYDSIYQYGRVALKRMTDDLSMAFLIGPNFKGKQSDGTPAMETSFVGEDEGDNDKVNFVTFSGLRFIKNEKKSDEAEVGYYIANCPDTEERVSCLMRRESGKIDKNVKEGGTSFVITKGIKKFNLEYYDTTKQEWRPDWNSKDPVFQDQLPRAVRITLVFNDPKKDDEEIPFVGSVMLPLSTGMIDF